jgi:hypothetical protein
MKTTTLRKIIVAASLGICAMASASDGAIRLAGTAATQKPACGNFVKPPEIRIPVMPRITPFPVLPICPGPLRPAPIRPDPIAKPISLGGAVCIPVPMPHFSAQDLLAVTGNDSGCVDRPGKPVRPIPVPTRPRPNI